MSEDIAEVLINHFPNASRTVLQEMQDEFTQLFQEAQRRLLTELLGRLPKEHDDIGNHDRETSSITLTQVEAFNQGIDRAASVIQELLDGLK